ncbi:Hypothetical protein ORPV_822 [Orpheovirus IHUMI-LCC2]|uniref:Uncharacterized protein n=1 Tax=Orpheovirus IHUMI-LCC2 TaxID=2023057 RepID=A0A2I2L5D0_9VIRU|nr:Hypothetical protein ORPV_822 [Orpheovirus IHUMI-LCC2]SNW62726.1 Hypothetical protein ORPV_822 [Orpheovirus IHUMI-LCC2]
MIITIIINNLKENFHDFKMEKHDDVSEFVNNMMAGLMNVLHSEKFRDIMPIVMNSPLVKEVLKDNSSKEDNHPQIIIKCNKDTYNSILEEVNSAINGKNVSIKFEEMNYTTEKITVVGKKDENMEDSAIELPCDKDKITWTLNSFVLPLIL